MEKNDADLFHENDDQKEETTSTKRPLPFKRKKRLLKRQEDILISKAIECIEIPEAKPDHLDEHIIGKYVAHELRGMQNIRLQKFDSI